MKLCLECNGATLLLLCGFKGSKAQDDTASLVNSEQELIATRHLVKVLPLLNMKRVCLLYLIRCASQILVQSRTAPKNASTVRVVAIF